MTSLEETCDDCPDPRWRFTTLVTGEVVDQVELDCTVPDAVEQADRLRTRQLAIVDQANAAGKDWQLKMECPTCLRGDVLTNATHILHVLAQHNGDPAEAVINAACGHACMATPLTHRLLLNDEIEHHTVCYPCHTKERT